MYLGQRQAKHEGVKNARNDHEYSKKNQNQLLFYLLFPSPHNFLHLLIKKGPKFNLNENLKRRRRRRKTSKFNLFPHLLFTPYPSPGYLHPTYRGSMGTLLLFWSYGCSLGSAIFMALLTLFFFLIRKIKNPKRLQGVARVTTKSLYSL